MGHRALVAYERPDGRYDVHYSHWGADLDLGRRITPETPFGRRSGDGPVVEPDPRASGLALVALIADHLDFLHHEALYLVGTDSEVTEYRVLQFLVATADGVLSGDETVGRGALVEVSPFDPGSGYVRGWFDGVRDAVGEMIDTGSMDERDAFGYLEDRLRRFAGLDREVMIDPMRDRDDFCPSSE